MNYSILETKPSGDYELLDSGDGEKLERYGSVVIARPDPQALWKKRLPEIAWNKVDAYFNREKTMTKARISSGQDSAWKTRTKVPERWEIAFADLHFFIKLSPFKHTGLFPEQAGNWEWVRSVIATRHLAGKQSPESKGIATSVASGDLPHNDTTVRVLNLFGYTGGATLAAAQAGAEVVHVDGSKAAIGWGRDNAAVSGLSEKPIRWILDDAVEFVKREIKRGHKYDGIILDPPAFGHGPTGEVWKIEEHLPLLLALCRQLLSEKPLFVLINGYASGYSALAYKNNLVEMMDGFKGDIEVGELTIAEKDSERLLPCGIFARWSA